MCLTHAQKACFYPDTHLPLFSQRVELCMLKYREDSINVFSRLQRVYRLDRSTDLGAAE